MGVCMVSNFFLFLIYVCYVMYGWCASLLGGVWPKIASDIGAEVSLLGVLVLVNYIASGAASSIVFKIRQKIGTNYSNVVGLFCYFISMIIFANANSIIIVALSMILLGLGSGIIDINSNSYVVKAYESKWVSFMHACWGIGATLGPIVMSIAMIHTPNYKYGFYFTAIMVVIVVIFFLMAKKSWTTQKKTLDKKYVEQHSVSDEEKGGKVNLFETLKIKNSLKVLLCFFLANGGGTSFSAWLATITVAQKSASVAEGAIAASAYFFALTAGRVFAGLATSKYKISDIIRVCIVVEIISMALFYVPTTNMTFVYIISAFCGFASGPFIPLLNSYLKEIYDSKYLSAIISLGGVFGLVGIGVISVVMTLFSKLISIDHVQLVSVICFVLFIIIFSDIVSSLKKQTA